MSVDTSGGHKDMDYAQHKATYTGFIKGAQISVVFLVLLMIAMAVFLV